MQSLPAALKSLVASEPAFGVIAFRCIDPMLCAGGIRLACASLPAERLEPGPVDRAIATGRFFSLRLHPVRALAHCENVTV